jgi:hypothetical protein
MHIVLTFFQSFAPGVIGYLAGIGMLFYFTKRKNRLKRQQVSREIVSAPEQPVLPLLQNKKEEYENNGYTLREIEYATLVGIGFGGLTSFLFSFLA